MFYSDLFGCIRLRKSGPNAICRLLIAMVLRFDS